MNMNNAFKEIFGRVQAEENLKNQTQVFLFEKTRGYTGGGSQKHIYQLCLGACICFFLIIFGGSWIYFTPIAKISIDINPSIEMSINRFDKVISIDDFNEDGRELSHSLDIKYRNYTEAIEEILNNDAITALLSDNEIMTITVIGYDEPKSVKILSRIESCTATHRNTHCYFAPSKYVVSAHETGLSCGKYSAFLELKGLDPNITPEMVQAMTMREIQELIDSLSPKEGNETSLDNYWRKGHHGHGENHKRKIGQ